MHHIRREGDGVRYCTVQMRNFIVAKTPLNNRALWTLPTVVRCKGRTSAQGRLLVFVRISLIIFSDDGFETDIVKRVFDLRNLLR